MERQIPKEALSSATRGLKRSYHPLQSTAYYTASEHTGCKFKPLLFLIWKIFFKSFPGSNIAPSVPGSTRGMLRWSTERQETGYAWLCQGRVAPLGSQVQCLELASQGEHLPWKQLLVVIQTGASELVESPADNEHKARAGVHLFFAGDGAMPVRYA